jgi:hypothetical protein
VNSTERITSAELARIRDQHAGIEQDCLPHIPPHEGPTEEDEHQ